MQFPYAYSDPYYSGLYTAYGPHNMVSPITVTITYHNIVIPPPPLLSTFLEMLASDSATGGGRCHWAGPTPWWNSWGGSHLCQCETVSWNTQKETNTCQAGGSEQTRQKSESKIYSLAPSMAPLNQYLVFLGFVWFNEKWKHQVNCYFHFNHTKP